MWAAHQDLLEFSDVIPERAESALVLRVGLEVEIIEIEAPAVVLINDLNLGVTVGEALSKLATEALDFEPNAIIALLIQKGAITGLKMQRSRP